MHHFCTICNSPFLRETSKEAEAVATTCGHVFHRDCVEGIIKIEPNPSCPICTLRLTADLYKIFLAYDDDAYDAVLERSVLSATAHGDRQLIEAKLGVQEYEAKLETLREQRAYNLEILESLDEQWNAVQAQLKIAEKRLRVVKDRVAASKREHTDLEQRLGALIH